MSNKMPIPLLTKKLCQKCDENTPQLVSVVIYKLFQRLRRKSYRFDSRSDTDDMLIFYPGPVYRYLNDITHPSKLTLFSELKNNLGNLR